ncbi:MAG: sugar ABC transporter permease [Ignisphaera sp.]
MITKKALKKNDFLKALPFLLPTLIVFSIFHYYSLGLLIYFSFTKWGLTGEPQWIGLKNYDKMFNTALFWKSLTLTLIFVVTVVAGSVALGLILAISVYSRDTRLSKVTRYLMLLPYVLPDVAAATMWLIMFGPGPSGYVNYILSLLRLPTSAWFYDPAMALPMVILYSIWKNTGFSALVIYAGLKSIPRDYIDAARVDGASDWQIYTRVVIPLLRPIIVFVTASIVMMSWFVFNSIYVLTKGGPGTATLLLGLYIYLEAFEKGNAGYACAVSVFSVLLVLGITILQLRWYRGYEKW